VLAGSLQEKSILVAARLAPELVAVRTAACDGGRDGVVSASRVRKIKHNIETLDRETRDERSPTGVKPAEIVT
jgi:hypothetical protein